VATDPDHQLAHAYLGRHDSLGPLAVRAADLIAMRRHYRDAMPEGLARNSQIFNYRRGTVIIGANNSAVAAKIKQLAPRLTALFLEKGWQVNAIQVQVQGHEKP
jgi:hypothetical protein